MTQVKKLFERRRHRTRWNIRKNSTIGVRLSIFRSGRNIYAQVIDDGKGHTLAAASSLEKDLRAKLDSGSDIAAAKEVGKLVADRAIKAGVKNVVFDRGGYIFHGRVKALADAAREAGLSF